MSKRVDESFFFPGRLLILFLLPTPQIVGPQLVKSQTLNRHYPELWLGIIIRYALAGPQGSSPPTFLALRSHKGRLINLVFPSYCLVIVLAITLIFILRGENRRRERLELDEREAERTAFEDLTDKENPHFRYVY